MFKTNTSLFLFFKMFSKFICSDGPTAAKTQLDYARIMISTSFSMLINEHISVKFEGGVFRIIILEYLSGSMVFGGDDISGGKEDSESDNNDISVTFLGDDEVGSSFEEDDGDLADKVV